MMYFILGIPPSSLEDAHLTLFSVVFLLDREGLSERHNQHANMQMGHYCPVQEKGRVSSCADFLILDRWS